MPLKYGFRVPEKEPILTISSQHACSLVIPLTGIQARIQDFLQGGVQLQARIQKFD
jgi:hypothetical protein